MKSLFFLTSLLIGESFSVPKSRPEVEKPVFHDKLMAVHYDIETRDSYSGSCENDSCGPASDDRVPQLFGFMDSFFDEPLDSPVSDPSNVDDSKTPVVIWHGLGQSCCDPNGIGRVKKIIEETTHAYVIAIKIGNSVLDDTINGFFMPVSQQIDKVCEQLVKDKKLEKGYYGIGFSQGGLFLRGLAQRCTVPPMKRLISMGAPQNGIYGIPRCPGLSLALCNLMRRFMSRGVYTGIVQSNLVVAQYWQDTMNFRDFTTQSRFLAEINNQGDLKNQSYALNMQKLEKFVLVMNLNDSTVIPIESQHFEFFAPGNDSQAIPLRETQLYKEDWIGLKTLDRSGRLVFIQIPGDHIEYETKWLGTFELAQFFACHAFL